VYINKVAICVANLVS